MANLYKYPFDKLDKNTNTFNDWFNHYNSLLDFLDDNRDLEPYANGTNLSLGLNSGWVHLPAGPKYFEATTIDLTQYKPVSNPKYVLIGIDYLGNLIIKEGAESTEPQYPDGSSLAPICLVYLTPDTTALNSTNVIDVRSVVGFSGTGSGGTGNNEDIKYYQLLQSEPFGKLFYDDFSNSDYLLPGANTGTFDIQNTKIVLNNGEYFVTNNILSQPYGFIKVYVDAKDLANLKIEYSVDNRQTYHVIQPSTLVEALVNDNLYLRFTSLVDGNEVYSYAVLYDYEQKVYYAKGKLYEVYTAESDLPAGTNITIPNNMYYTNNGVSLIVHDNTGLRWLNGQDYKEIDDRTIQILKPLNANQQLIFEEYYSTIQNELDAVMKNKFWLSEVQFDTNVQNGDIVIRQSDGKYYQANVNDVTNQNVIGLADVTNNRVYTNGILTIQQTFNIGDIVYLDKSTAGGISTTPSPVKLGVMIDTSLMLFKPEIINYNTLYTKINADYTTQNEKIIAVDTSSQAITITLATNDVYEGKEFIIKDLTGNAGTNHITIQTEGSETIDGNDTISITTDNGSVHLISDGSNWFTV